jgi:hypothetical protein
LPWPSAPGCDDHHMNRVMTVTKMTIPRSFVTT